jgi:hypothetical protein
MNNPAPPFAVDRFHGLCAALMMAEKMAAGAVGGVDTVGLPLP